MGETQPKVPPTDGDRAACHDVEIQRWTTVPAPYSPAAAVGYVTGMAATACWHGGAKFAVVEGATGNLASDPAAAGR